MNSSICTFLMPFILNQLTSASEGTSKFTDMISDNSVHSAATRRRGNTAKGHTNRACARGIDGRNCCSGMDVARKSSSSNTGLIVCSFFHDWEPRGAWVH